MATHRIIKSNYLAHHGVKGMKWGVWNEETKARYAGGQRIRKTPEERGFVKIGTADGNTTFHLYGVKSEKDTEWFKQATDIKTYFNTYNTAVDVVNDYLLPKINEEWDDIDIENDEVMEAKYTKQVMDAFDDALNTVGNYSVYNSPGGELMIAYRSELDTQTGLPAIDVYSRNKKDVRAKKMQDAYDKGLDNFNRDIGKLSDKFLKDHNLPLDYDLGKNKKLLKEYDRWMMEQHDNYIELEQSKI